MNETFDDKTLLRKYREEIEELKAKLAEMETMVRETSRLEVSKLADEGVDEDDKDNANIVLQVGAALLVPSMVAFFQYSCFPLSLSVPLPLSVCLSVCVSVCVCR